MKRTGVLAILSTLFALCLGGPISASQESPSPSEAKQPCIVDERLSIWLSLEAADRTIALLERERRELATERVQLAEQLELVSRSKSGSLEEGSLSELSAALNAASEGVETMDESYLQIEARLVEIDRTLERRRAQRDDLEHALARLSEQKD